MPNVTMGGETIACQPDETVLEVLLRARISIPNGCRQGICQSCLMRSIHSSPPALAQTGLKESLRKQNYFLACICHPEQDMTVTLPESVCLSIAAEVLDKQLLTPKILRLILEYQADFDFHAGQFINLQRPDGLTRSYSIANRPQQDKRLEFHIRRLENGQFSRWVFDELNIGDRLILSEAQGDCHYLPSEDQPPLLLIGTGTGLAPLWGIINDALEQGHQAPIHLFHGSRDEAGLYFMDEIHQLASRYENFTYTLCVSGVCASAAFTQGRAHDVALARHENLKGWRIYLCGHPDMVKQSKTRAYLKGASLKDIYADAFLVTPHKPVDPR